MSSKAEERRRFKFEGFDGFDSPNTTPVPDVFFDLLAPALTEAELRVLLYIIRRIYGFKKEGDADNISLKQLVDGIVTRDGRVLDHGAGVAKSAAVRAVKGLVEKNLVLARRNSSPERGDQPTTYTLRFRKQLQDRGVFSKRTRGGLPKGRGGVLLENTQETGLQETVRQQTDKISNSFEYDVNLQQTREPSGLSKARRSDATMRVSDRGASPMTAVGQILAMRQKRARKEAPGSPETGPETADAPRTRPRSRTPSYGGQNGARRAPAPKLPPYVEDLVARYSRELHDPDHVPQNLGQAGRLWKASGRSEDAFSQALIEAKAITLERNVHKRAKAGGELGTRNKMPYFFKVLRDLLGMKEETPSTTKPFQPWSNDP